MVGANEIDAWMEGIRIPREQLAFHVLDRVGAGNLHSDLEHGEKVGVGDARREDQTSKEGVGVSEVGEENIAIRDAGWLH